MAIVPMKKVGILAHNTNFDSVTSTLGELGIVQITIPPGITADSGKELEEITTRIHRVADFLESFPDKTPPRLKLPHCELSRIASEFDVQTVLGDIEENRRELEELKSRKINLGQAIDALSPYSSVPFALGKLVDTPNVGIRLGFLPKERVLSCFSPDSGIADLIDKRTVSKDLEGEYLLIMFHKSVEEEVEKALAECNFAQFHIGDSKETPILEISRMSEELSEVVTSISTIEKTIRDTAKSQLPLLKALEGYFRADLAEKRLIDLSESTEQTLYLTGWIKGRDVDGLQKSLARESDAILVETINPDEREAPPVALKNPPVVEAFEVITDLYGRPRAGMVDPTPFIAPFFPIFFGLCLTDAGYGLLLTLLGGGFLLFGKLGSGAKKFMRFILYSGIATVIIGALAGGWFGADLVSMNNPIAHTLLSIKLFDPLADAIQFFAASVFLGVLQVSVGYVLSGYVGAKESQNGILKLRAILLALSWIAVTIGAGTFVANYLIPETMAPVMPIGLSLLKFGALGIVGFSIVLGIAGKRGIGGSISDGLAFDGLYGIVSLFGDLLSYARILALGLSTGVIAGVINIIAKQLAEMIPGVGIIVAALLVIVGHVAYTGLSALGAFVHPARLHFVEYFTKFYEAGGEPFEPYRREVEGVDIVE